MARSAQPSHNPNRYHREITLRVGDHGLTQYRHEVLEDAAKLFRKNLSPANTPD